MRETLQFSICLFAATMIACADKGPQIPAYCTNEAAFTAALVRCVDSSPTRSESQACRKAVHERCGIVEKVSER